MDDRVRRHAEILVEQCAEVEQGDMVRVVAPPVAEDLVVAVYEKLGEVGARPTLSWRGSRATRAYDRAMDAEGYERADHTLAMLEETDAYIGINGSRNLAERSDVPGENVTANRRANEELQEALRDIRWVGTQYPAPGNAQKAGMSTAAYEDFVYRAVDRDWDEQRAFQSQMVDILRDASEVRIVSGDHTDLRMSVDGMVAKNDADDNNMPGGEAFTAPVPDTVEGEVLFDQPRMWRGEEILDARLTFEGGEVVEYSARQNEDALEEILETDDGAKRLGELGVGMNRGIDRFTYNMLFDEKMGDTIHLAVGNAYPDTVGEDRERNESAIHVDFITDMSEDSYIEVDGEIVQRNGTFRFEDGFEAEA
ncbi:aminopeptidase [Halobacterium litoreum]|uniref:Aminopeptidase n=1 Tax=Halobacterium litoreum TaxID=2039234 RepID=A0ABD5N9N6_9EURY|nr:aminopeptidase [Halobacterium litoreum]UHH12135.1 aminopeptidase [Halobacterium litoreum]